MSIEIKVPALPESVTDATLVAWHKKVGETVRRDENLVDLETDKVVLEVPAPADGVLQEIRVEDGVKQPPSPPGPGSRPRRPSRLLWRKNYPPNLHVRPRRGRPARLCDGSWRSTTSMRRWLEAAARTAV
jgi:hypothetical protein